MSKDVAVANRSGKPAGIVVGILSLAGILYDEQHWHLVHHVFGRISWIFAIVLCVGLGWLTKTLVRREAGHVQISSKGESE